MSTDYDEWYTSQTFKIKLRIFWFDHGCMIGLFFINVVGVMFAMILGALIGGKFLE